MARGMASHEKPKNQSSNLAHEKRGTRNEKPGFAGISFHELLSYAEGENRRWRSWFKQHPEALAVEAGIADAQNIYELVMHISSVQMRLAQLCAGEAMGAAQLRALNIEQAFELAERGTARLREVLENSTQEQLEEILSFPDDEKSVPASRRKLMADAFLHGVRHWAQIATALRKAGYPQTWPHDLLYSEAMK